MNQLKISIFTSYLRIFIVFFILIIYLDNNHVSANGIYDRRLLDNNDGELIYPDETFYLKKFMPENIGLIRRRSVWSRLFRSETNQPQLNSHTYFSPTASGFTFSKDRIHIIPFDKRTIPIELQKALYAHGIVGRRR